MTPRHVRPLKALLELWGPEIEMTSAVLSPGLDVTEPCLLEVIAPDTCCGPRGCEALSALTLAKMQRLKVELGHLGILLFSLDGDQVTRRKRSGRCRAWAQESGNTGPAAGGWLQLGHVIWRAGPPNLRQDLSRCNDVVHAATL